MKYILVSLILLTLFSPLPAKKNYPLQIVPNTDILEVVQSKYSLEEGNIFYYDMEDYHEWKLSHQKNFL